MPLIEAKARFLMDEDAYAPWPCVLAQNRALGVTEPERPKQVRTI